LAQVSTAFKQSKLCGASPLLAVMWGFFGGGKQENTLPERRPAVLPDVAVQGVLLRCCTSGCSRPPWNGQPGQTCCRTCGKNKGHRHGPDCDLQEVQRIGQQGRASGQAASLPAPQATPVLPVAAAGTAVLSTSFGSTAAQQLQPSQPAAVRQEQVPSAPSHFPELSKLSDAELQYFKDNPTALDDWLLRLPPVTALQERERKAQEHSAELASKLLAREADFQASKANSAEAAAAYMNHKAAVDELMRSRDAIIAQNSPETLAITLGARAKTADLAAEGLVQHHLHSPGVMDAADIASLRTRYLQQKGAKHKRLAMKLRLECSVQGGA